MCWLEADRIVFRLSIDSQEIFVPVAADGTNQKHCTGQSALALLDFYWPQRILHGVEARCVDTRSVEMVIRILFYELHGQEAAT